MNITFRRPIYLDYQATTPVDQRVVDAMLPYFTETFGNPNSAGHIYGAEANAVLVNGRRVLSDYLNGAAGEVVFLSGATEANNMVLKGVMKASGGERPHLVTVATEHACVLRSAKTLAADGYDVTILGVGADGLVDLDDLASVVNERTALVSVMAVNNEIGVVQPLARIGAIAHQAGALFHTDAAQMFGKLPMDVEQMGIDFLSLTAHKFYGPKGIGALWIRKSACQSLAPILCGGGQEGGLRSGTQAPAQIAGLVKAAEVAHAEMDAHHGQMTAYRDRFLHALSSAVPALRVNGHMDQRWAGNLNITFPGVKLEPFNMALGDLALSRRSACSSGSEKPSYVLKALGLSDDDALRSLRISFGKGTTPEDLDRALKIFAKAYDWGTR